MKRYWWTLVAASLFPTEYHSGWRVGVVQQELRRDWKWGGIHFIDPNIFFPGNDSGYAFFKGLDPSERENSLESMVTEGFATRSSESTYAEALITPPAGAEKGSVRLAHATYTILDDRFFQVGNHPELFENADRERESRALSTETGSTPLPMHGFKGVREAFTLNVLGPHLSFGYDAYPKKHGVVLNATAFVGLPRGEASYNTKLMGVEGTLFENEIFVGLVHRLGKRAQLWTLGGHRCRYLKQENRDSRREQTEKLCGWMGKVGASIPMGRDLKSGFLSARLTPTLCVHYYYLHDSKLMDRDQAWSFLENKRWALSYELPFLWQWGEKHGVVATLNYAASIRHLPDQEKEVDVIADVRTRGIKVEHQYSF